MSNHVLFKNCNIFRVLTVIMNEQHKISRPIEIANKVTHLNIFKLKNAGILYIYSLNYEQMLTVHELLKKEKGEIGYLSLHGIKDVILKSTMQPMKLLHVQWGKNKTYTTKYPQPNYTHMFCLHEKNKIKKFLDKNNITTNVTATIMQYNMDDFDWDFILTSDI